MKTFVKLLAVLVLLVGLVYGYIAWGPGLTASLDSVDRQPASERADAFRTIVEGVERGDFGTNQFGQPASQNPGDYTFVTITLTVRNLYPLAAEWALVNITPLSGDLVLIQGEPADIRPFGSAKISATVLALNADQGEPRMAWLEYYLFGEKKSAAAQ